MMNARRVDGWVMIVRKSRRNEGHGERGEWEELS
jgi:hypothetical protein